VTLLRAKWLGGSLTSDVWSVVRDALLLID
jgi:hypothetical protein